MITDVRASQLFLLLHEGESVAGIAGRLEMSEKTIRKYRNAGLLPSQMERPQRTYRTRPDPLEEFWSEIEERLEHDSRLKPYAILDWLKQKYNSPAGELRVTDSIRRTLERRVQRWKLEHGVRRVRGIRLGWHGRLVRPCFALRQGRASRPWHPPQSIVMYGVPGTPATPTICKAG